MRLQRVVLQAYQKNDYTRDSNSCSALKSEFLLAPLLHGEEDGYEALALRGEGIFHARRHLAEVGARKKAVVHQFPELLTVARRCTERSKLDDGMR